MDQTLHPVLNHYIAWLKAHERLVIILGAGFLAFHFYGNVLNAWIDHDKRNVALQQTVAQDAQQKSQVDSKQNVQLLQQLADLKLQYSNLSAQLQITAVKRAQDTAAQKKINDSSNNSEVAARTASVLRVETQEITVDSNGTLSFSTQAAHDNINALEDGDQAKADVIDLGKQISACVAVSTKQDETITGVRQELTDEKISHQADVKLEQDKTKLAVDNGKKQFRRGFKYGAIVGFLGGLFVGHKI